MPAFRTQLEFWRQSSPFFTPHELRKGYTLLRTLPNSGYTVDAMNKSRVLLKRGTATEWSLKLATILLKLSCLSTIVIHGIYKRLTRVEILDPEPAVLMQLILQPLQQEANWGKTVDVLQLVLGSTNDISRHHQLAIIHIRGRYAGNDSKSNDLGLLIHGECIYSPQHRAYVLHSVSVTLMVAELAASNFGVNFHNRSTIAQRVTQLHRQLHSLLGQVPANRNGHIFLPIFQPSLLNYKHKHQFYTFILVYSLHPRHIEFCSAVYGLCFVFHAIFRVLRFCVNFNNEFRVSN
ncbi:hypothetical protein VNO78_28881 [Psophocarpus tetragonolobus]|uniref:Uncharacterized protein n=1 Tax=Psophocarpus tetragonolobus TaxID=3891 RepID=A0AAN9RU36_PSOTE